MESYSGVKNYLISCWVCKSYINEESLIFYSSFILIERQTINQKSIKTHKSSKLICMALPLAIKMKQLFESEQTYKVSRGISLFTFFTFAQEKIWCEVTVCVSVCVQ